ncbi:MAG: hypothetical protein ABSE47_07445 [Acidimicrobiales bacterium]|jgi:hypothetical protein
MLESTEVQYLALPDRDNPYLLARVRWPDVAQAISSGCSEWQHDPGIFDLPYHPGCEKVTADEASEIASRWDATLSFDEPVTSFGQSLIRRMPPDWSNLSRAERRAFYIEFAPTRRSAAASRRARRRDSVVTPSHAKRRRSLLPVRSRSTRRAVLTAKGHVPPVVTVTGMPDPHPNGVLVTEATSMATAATGFERATFMSRVSLGVAPATSWQDDADPDVENSHELVAESTIAS